MVSGVFHSSPLPTPSPTEPLPLKHADLRLDEFSKKGVNMTMMSVAFAAKVVSCSVPVQSMWVTRVAFQLFLTVL